VDTVDKLLDAIMKAPHSKYEIYWKGDMMHVRVKKRKEKDKWRQKI